MGGFLPQDEHRLCSPPDKVEKDSVCLSKTGKWREEPHTLESAAGLLGVKSHRWGSFKTHL